MAKTVTAKALIDTQFASSTSATEYTAPASPNSTRAIIDKFTVTNVTGSAETVSVWLIPDGQTENNAYKVVDEESVAANSSEELTVLKNHVLDAGGFIKVVASAGSSLVIRCSGREVVTT